MTLGLVIKVLVGLLISGVLFILGIIVRGSKINSNESINDEIQQYEDEEQSQYLNNWTDKHRKKA